MRILPVIESRWGNDLVLKESFCKEYHWLNAKQDSIRLAKRFVHFIK